MALIFLNVDVKVDDRQQSRFSSEVDLEINFAIFAVLCPLCFNLAKRRACKSRYALWNVDSQMGFLYT